MKIFNDNRPLFGQDPHLTKVNDKWILCESVDEKHVRLSYLDLEQKKRVFHQVVWENESEQQLWAPELHRIDGLWYIYYASSNGENHTHRTMVAGAAMNPFGPYNFSVPVGPDVWGIDMNVFAWKGQRYAVWSGWQNNKDEFPQHLFIAPMISPVEIGERTLLASPYLQWQLSVAPILEGPQAFVDYGTLYILYSANASWKQEYSTGILELVGENPLNPLHWVECPWPLMTNAGHGMMTSEHFVYHRKMSNLAGWADREIVTIPRGELLNSKEFQTFKGNLEY